MSKLLWVDDRPDLVKHHVQACRELGHEVSLASNPRESMEIARREGGTIDLVLIDVVMPDGGGYTLAHKLEPYIPKAKKAFVTSYPDVNVEGDRKDEWIQVIDRDDLPQPGDPKQVEGFITRLLNPDGRGFLHEQSFTMRGVRDITYGEYREESLEGRMALNEQAQKHPKIERLLKEGGFYWMLVCGDYITIAKSAAEVMSNTEITRIAEEQNRAPFQFYADMDIEDLSPMYCEGDLGGYPFVRIQLSQKTTLDIHYDTGSMENLLKFETVKNFVDTNNPLYAAHISIRGKRLKAWTADLKQAIIDNAISATEAFENIPIVLVKEWEETNLFKDRRCPQDSKRKCVNKDTFGHKGEFCYFRQHGLLGRRLQYCVGRYLLISPDDARISFLDEDVIRKLQNGNHFTG